MLWYDEGFVTVCYEYLADILKNAPEDTLPSGITRQDAILGPFVDVFLHERARGFRFIESACARA